MDSCSEAYNLTDCLLQSLLDGITDHNKWDVPSFVVTLVIGVVALCFAAMTVVQGVAGPGQRKSSRYAIGNWNEKTQHEWNLSECRRDSIAYTPLLTLDLLRSRWDDTVKGDVYGGATVGDLEAGPPRGSDTNKDQSLATWLGLLIYVRLDQFVWERLEKETKSVRADYLPPRVQAVPSHMDIDTIVVLAAAAGCCKLTIEPTFGYPVMTGANVQVFFRRDLLIGVVASFEHYSSDEKPPIEAQRNRLSRIFESSRRFESRHCALGSKSEPFIITTEPNVIGPCVKGPADLIIDFTEKDTSPCHHVGKMKLCRCWTLFLDLTKQHNFFWLLYDTWKDKEIFPAKRANLERVLGAIFVQGSYWSKNHPFKAFIFSKLSPVEGEPSLSDWTQFWPSTGKKKSPPKPWEVFAFCLHFTEDLGAAQNSFLRLPLRRKIAFREALALQMDAVDDEINMLEKSEPDNSMQCARVELYIRAAAIMTLEPFEESIVRELYKDATHLSGTVVVSNARSRAPNILRLLRVININKEDSLTRSYNFFHGLFDCWAVELDILINSLSTLALEEIQSTGALWHELDKYKAKDPISLIKEMGQVVDPMRELLVYRAVLLAVLCLSALDNSDVLNLGIGNEIVGFL